MAQKDNSDVGQMPFERAIDELESIVKRLEEGKVPLEESVAIYERGEVLKRRCEELLRLAEARVEKIFGADRDACVSRQPQREVQRPLVAERLRDRRPDEHRPARRLDFPAGLAEPVDMYDEDDYAAFVRYCFEDPLDAEIFRARFEPKIERFKLAG